MLGFLPVSWTEIATVISTFAGFLSALIVAFLGRVLYDWWTSPKLCAYPTRNDPSVQEEYRRAFYHITIRNARKRLGLMVKPVENARVTIVYYSEKKEEFSIPAKWDFRPEPLRYEKEGISLDPSLIPQAELLDISPGSEQSLCICMKYKGDENIYGFNAFSYLHPDLKNPDWKLGKGKYKVRAILIAANAYAEFSVALQNLGTDFNDVKVADPS